MATLTRIEADMIYNALDDLRQLREALPAGAVKVAIASAESVIRTTTGIGWPITKPCEKCGSPTPDLGDGIILCAPCYASLTHRELPR